MSARRFTPPTSPASPGFAAFSNDDAPFRPLTPIPSPLCLAAGMVAADLFKFFVGFGMVVGVGGLLVVSTIVGTNNLPAGIAALLVTCFGVGFFSFVIAKARGFGGGFGGGF